MVAYFCHHLSDNYVDLSDLYVDMSVIYVDLFIMLTFQKKIIKTSSLISCFYSMLLPLIAIYFSILYLTSQHNDLTSGHNFRIVDIII